MKISYQVAIDSQVNCSSKGNQQKYYIDDNWIKVDYLGYEGAAEYFCSKVLEHSNIKNYINYHIIPLEIERRTDCIIDRLGCVSKNFLPQDTEIITLDQLFTQYGLKYSSLTNKKSIQDSILSVVQFIEDKTGIQNYGQYLTMMLEFDAFVLNEDRHTNNVLFLYKDRKYTVGPIFDNGASYLSDTYQDYPLNESITEHIKNVKTKLFTPSFEKQLKACHELYGKQLILDNFDIKDCISEINKYYDNLITRRIQFVYNFQKEKYKDFFQKTNKEITQTELQSTFIQQLKKGEKAVCSILSQDYQKEIVDFFLQNKIPYTILTDKTNQKIVAVLEKDKDSLIYIQEQRNTDLFSLDQDKIEQKER